MRLPSLGPSFLYRRASCGAPPVPIPINGAVVQPNPESDSSLAGESNQAILSFRLRPLFGLASRGVYRFLHRWRKGGLLPRLFTLTRMVAHAGGFLFCDTFHTAPLSR